MKKVRLLLWYGDRRPGRRMAWDFLHTRADSQGERKVCQSESVPPYRIEDWYSYHKVDGRTVCTTTYIALRPIMNRLCAGRHIHRTCLGGAGPLFAPAGGRLRQKASATDSERREKTLQLDIPVASPSSRRGRRPRRRASLPRPPASSCGRGTHAGCGRLIL